MSYDPDNIFAKILRGEMPAVRICEDDRTLAFMDAFPQTRGHALVVPKHEAKDILDCSPEVLANLIVTTQMVARAVDKALAPDGLMVGQFNRAPAGQTVFHLHFHVIPRYAGVTLRGHGTGKMADPNELEETASLIRASL